MYFQIVHQELFITVISQNWLTCLHISRSLLINILGQTQGKTPARKTLLRNVFLPHLASPASPASPVSPASPASPASPDSPASLPVSPHQWAVQKRKKAGRDSSRWPGPVSIRTRLLFFLDSTSTQHQTIRLVLPSLCTATGSSASPMCSLTVCRPSTESPPGRLQLYKPWTRCE